MNKDRRHGLERVAGRLGVAALAASIGVGVAPIALGAQPRDELVPVVPPGLPVVVLPVQSVQPTPGGAWPGGATTREAALENMGAELAFAFGEQRGAASWMMPTDVVDRVSRNPILRVDPRRLAYHGLLRKPKEKEQLYEPLHGQLRKLAALFGARLVVLPLALWYEPEPGRAVLLMALVDVRRAAVLWHGQMEGDLAAPRSPALLATLAQRVARQLSPS